MHIPDGYLSPATCATLYATSFPFWYTALKKVNRLMNTRVVPLLSLFAAFSFVVMMFNLPLPGGTTGHAAGMGIAAIVLGPWAGMLAISIALLVQAVFFGDGGITAFGANCFNMAIVGSFLSYGVYRLLSARSAVTATRRVLAAGVAGYVGINAAAFCAAIEFGIQPMLFHDAQGVPLYAPYPLHIALPAMMLGHLTFAGLAEMFLTAGLVAYLQKSNPSLLQASLGDPLPEEGGAVGLAPRVASTSLATPRRALARLWAALALLMVLTPLGLVAVGTAWGEWSASDFANPRARQQIAAASSNELPVARAPIGLEKLSAVWTAPIPRYAPRFFHSLAFGYIISAFLGVGLVILCWLGLHWISLQSSRLRPTCPE